MEIKIGYVCDKGLNPRRPVNQDRYVSLPGRGLFAVFDGVGGQRAGEVASQTAADTIQAALAAGGPDAERIRRAIEAANQTIFDMARRDPALNTMATTVALLQLDRQRAVIAHVGDSRVYQLEAGRIYRETIDHNDIEDQIRAGLLRREQVAHLPESNTINRALGAEPEVDVEINVIELREGVRFLLCSDGIYKHLSDEEIGQVLASNADPQRAADELKRLVYERGADDNLTAIVVQAGRAPRLTRPRASPGRPATQAGDTEGFAAPAADHGHDFVYAETREMAAPVPPAETQEMASPVLGGPGVDEDDTPTAPLARPEPTTTRPDRRIHVEISDPPPPAFADELAATAALGDPARPAGGRAGRAILTGLLIGLAFVGGLYLADYLRPHLPGLPGRAGTTDDVVRRARGHFDKKEFEPAEKLLLEHTRDSADPEAFYWLGRAQIELGRYEPAARNLSRALELNPGAPDTYAYAAAALWAAGREDEARKVLNQYRVNFGGRRAEPAPAAGGNNANVRTGR